MTKQQLINRLAESNGITQKEAKEIVHIFFNSLLRALIDNQRVELRGFGSFKVKDYNGFVGRNPKTGDTVKVKPKRLPFFKVGKIMKEKVNMDPQAS